MDTGKRIDQSDVLQSLIVGDVVQAYGDDGREALHEVRSQPSNEASARRAGQVKGADGPFLSQQRQDSHAARSSRHGREQRCVEISDVLT